MGFAVHRQVYADDIDFDYEYYTTADDQERQPTKPVPIWLCVFLVVSYIFGGAFLFSEWEQWPFLDSAYFCFITLTTIGARWPDYYFSFSVRVHAIKTPMPPFIRWLKLPPSRSRSFVTFLERENSQIAPTLDFFTSETPILTCY